MVKPTIRQAAKRAGIKTAYKLQQATGFSSSMAYALWADDGESIAFATLEKLCQVLKCDIKDLVKRTKK